MRSNHFFSSIAAAGFIISLLILPSKVFSSDTSPVEVKTKRYQVTIEPAKGGRISRLQQAGSDINLSYEGLGIGTLTRTDMAQQIGFDLQLGLEVVRSEGKTEVILSTLPESLALQGNLSYKKKYIFREDTLVIQVQVELTNHGAGGIIGWRMYSDLVASPENKANVFQEHQETAGCTEDVWAENNPGDARKWGIWESAGSGWGGVDTGLGQTVFFWTPPEGVAAIYSYADDKSAAYEMRMQEPIDRGETLTRNFFIIPVATDSPRNKLAELKKELPADLEKLITSGSGGNPRRVNIEHKVEKKEAKENLPPFQSDAWYFGGPSGLQVRYGRYLNQPPDYMGNYPSLPIYDTGVGFDGGSFGYWYRGNAIRVLINGADIFAQKPARLTEEKEGVNGYLRMSWELEKGGEVILNFTIPEDGSAIYARIDVVPGELFIRDIQVRLNCYPGGFGPAYKEPSHRWVVTSRGEWDIPQDYKGTFPEAPVEQGEEWIFYADKLQSKGSLGLLFKKDEGVSGRVRMSSYGEATELDYPAETRHIHLAFYAFEKDNETSRNNFLSSLEKQKELLIAGPYWPDAAEERVAAARLVQPDIIFTEKSDRILLVGRTNRYRFYRVEAALSRTGFAGRVDVAHLNYNTPEGGIYGFPISAQGISAYRMIVFIDTPYFYLPPAMWQLTERFIMSGGSVVFVGDQASGGYKGSNIARLIPVEFDYAKVVKGMRHEILNERAPYSTLEPPVKDSPITKGLDYSAPPQVSVYNNKIKSDSMVLLKAGSNPVLSCRKAGKGIVYSFPVCLTPNYHIPYDNDEPEYEGSSVIPIKAEPPGERDKSIFMWSQYDSVWYGLATAAIHGEGAIVAKDKPAPQQKFSFTMVVGDDKGLCKIYRRGYQFPVNISFADAAPGDITVSLVDPWNRNVWKNPVKYQDSEVSLKIPTEGLAYGQYTLIAERGREQIKDTINILPDYRYSDNFFITSLGGTNFSDDPEEQLRLLKEAKEDGANLINTTDQYRPELIRWPARWRRELAERVMLSGMIPAHMDQIAGGWGSSAHGTDEGLTRDVQASLGMLERFWGMAPRGIMTYIFDEPGHFEFVKDCKVCNEEYLKRYGGESVPKEKGTPGYYNLASIMDRAAIDGWIRKAKIWHEKDTEKLLTPWGITNEGSLLMEHSVWLARSWGGYGVDMFSYSPGNWQAQYAFDMALAAVDYDPYSLGFQIEAGSYYGGTPVAAQRGQGAYSVLARGARLIQWYDWGWTKIQGKLGIMPERFEAVRKASLEAQKIGPVLAGMKRPQAKIAMLVPSALQYTGAGDDRRSASLSLTAAYKAAQVSCGNIDFLYYQHLREGKLNGYNLMLLAGNEWMDNEMLEIILGWVEKGGTLIVMPRSLMYDAATIQQPEKAASTFPFKYYGALADVKVEGLDNRPAYAWELWAGDGSTVKYKYGDGKPAAVSFNRGSGRIYIFAFVPGSARDMEKIFSDMVVDPWTTRSDDENSSAWLLKSGKGYYAVAVNSENTAKTAHIRLRTDFDRQPVVYDMLTGEKQPVKLETDGVILLDVVLEPFWGRAFVLLPAEPAVLSVTPSSGSFKAGGTAGCQIRILDRNKGIIAARIPVEVKVTDASGRGRSEYGGYRIAEDGVLKLLMALGTNDPAGEWKIEARQTWTGMQGRVVLKVE